MNEFSDNAYVEIQGRKVLELREQNEVYATYALIGFGDSVTVRDYRRRSLDALSAYMLLDPNHDFAVHFSQPAFVSASVDDNEGLLLIELRQPRESDIRNALWMAVGADGKLPVLDYIVRGVSPLESNRYSIVALYKLAQQDNELGGHASFADESTLDESLLCVSGSL